MKSVVCLASPVKIQEMRHCHDAGLRLQGMIKGQQEVCLSLDSPLWNPASLPSRYIPEPGRSVSASFHDVANSVEQAAVV